MLPYHLVISVHVGIFPGASTCQRIERIVGDEERHLRLHLHNIHHHLAVAQRVVRHRILYLVHQLPVLFCQEEYCKIVRLLYSDTSMRYSPLLSFKDSPAAGIMQIDREVVVESEDDASQGIALSSALHSSPDADPPPRRSSHPSHSSYVPGNSLGFRHGGPYREE